MPKIEAVLLAAISNMLIGAFWYSPQAFGRVWQQLIGKNYRELSVTASLAYRASFVAAIISAYFLARLMGYIQASTIWQGMITGIWVWLGFVFASFVPAYFFAKRPVPLLLIDTGYQLAALVVMGFIISLFM